MYITMRPDRDLESKEQEKKRFFDLADRLEHAKEPSERKQMIKETLARMTFGDQAL
jgi:hypothetical protein